MGDRVILSPSLYYNISMLAKRQFKIALYFFAAIALLGLILRLVPVMPLGVTYANVLHAHSHTAFLGWLHGGFIAFISFIFLKDKLQSRQFKNLYFFTIFNIAGIYISFLFQGYKFFSILFLSLFLIATYWFLIFFFKNKTEDKTYPATFRFIRAGLWLQFLSSLSPWSLGAVIKFLGKKSVFYKFDIFYYLHFQYNGWFLFASIGLALYLLERRNITLPALKVNWLYRLMLIAVFFGYFSNTLWAKPGWFFNFLALIGGSAEIVAFFMLLLIFKRYYRYLYHTISDFSYKVLQLVLVTFMIKAVLQFMGSFPYYADLTYSIRGFIIGYLHLVMLGIFTPFLLVLADEFQFIRLKKTYFKLFYIAFFITESIIFMRAVLWWFKIDADVVLLNWVLFIFTLFLAIGIWLIVFTKNKKNV